MVAGRPVIALLLALLCGGSLAAPARGAASAGPADFEQRVPAAAGDATPPLTAPARFDLLGLRWDRGDAHVELRVRRVDGWSRWIEAPHAGDAPAAGARTARAARASARDPASGPVWTGSARRYQLRAAHGTTLPPGLRVHFVAVPRPVAAPLPAARTSTDGPAIVPRSQWDPTNACPPKIAPRYGRVDFGFVHHTESLASSTPAESAAVVLAICRFHRNGNGWLDIGYNLLVDRWGTVFEGRAGGVEQPVIGAQAGGWNSVSTGVAVIGSFSRERPPAAAQESLAQVLAWKLSLAGVPALGSVVQTSYGGDENRWSAGTRVRFQRVAGHRDGDRTDCPGAALYAMLPSLRAAVAARHAIPQDLLTSSPIGGTLAPGGPAQLTGRLALADGTRPVGARLTLQQRSADEGAWEDVGALRTSGDGVWAASVPVTTNAAFRVAAPGYGLVAPAVRAAVQAGVSAQVTPQLRRVGGSVRLRGTTAPAKPGVTVLVERQARRDGPWAAVTRTRVATDAAGAYDRSFTLTAAGVHRFTVATDADATNAAGYAPIRTAKVLPSARSRGRGR